MSLSCTAGVKVEWSVAREQRPGPGGRRVWRWRIESGPWSRAYGSREDAEGAALRVLRTFAWSTRDAVAAG